MTIELQMLVWSVALGLMQIALSAMGSVSQRGLQCSELKPPDQQHSL